jgi:hypothetical protein
VALTLCRYNSVIVNEASGEALAEAVLGLIRDRERREAMGVRARLTVLEGFRAEDQMGLYDRLYQQLLHQR